MTYRPINSQTAFLNTSLVFSDDPAQRTYELTKFVTDVANYINLREISQYELVELLNGQQFTDENTSTKKKFVYRKVFYFNAIPSGSPLNIAHGIVGFQQFTNMYGTCITEIPDYRPIPRVSTIALNQQISLNVTEDNIEIINGAASPNILSGIIVLEYLKN